MNWYAVQSGEIVMQDETLNINDVHIPSWDELPDIALYMDQLLNFINERSKPFTASAGHPELTATMVNNYVRAKIVDAPVKKKYSKKSLAMIIVVYLLKSCYTTEEIDKLIRMGLELGSPEEIYERFRVAMEEAIKSVFSGHIDLWDEHLEGRENKYLMGNFALSFACKLYVQKEFLMKSEK